MELDKKKILTFAVIFSILGISALYAFTTQTASRDMEVSEIDEELLGSRVSTEGTISDISWLSYIVLFDLKEEETEESLQVACDREIIDGLDEKEKIMPGARVSVEGKLEEYEDEVQLKIDSQDSISVEKSAYSDFTPISEILEKPSWYEGMEVKIRGDIVEVYAADEVSSLILTEIDGESYEITCEVDGEIKEDNISGKPVVVEGRIVYDSNTGTWMIRASAPLDFK